MEMETETPFKELAAQNYAVQSLKQRYAFGSGDFRLKYFLVCAMFAMIVRYFFIKWEGNVSFYFSSLIFVASYLGFYLVFISLIFETWYVNLLQKVFMQDPDLIYYKKWLELELQKQEMYLKHCDELKKTIDKNKEDSNENIKKLTEELNKI